MFLLSFTFLIFFLLVASDGPVRLIPDYVLEMYNKCGLSDYIPVDASEARIYAVVLEGESSYWRDYTVDLHKSTWSKKPPFYYDILMPNMRFFWRPDFRKASAVVITPNYESDSLYLTYVKWYEKFETEPPIYLPNTKKLSMDQTIVTPKFVDVLFEDGSVNRLNLPDNNVEVRDQMPTEFLYSYRQEGDVLYGFSRENGVIKCHQWRNYGSGTVDFIRRDPCPEGKDFLKHPSRTDTIDFLSLLYATGCFDELWDEFFKVKPAPADILFTKLAKKTTTLEPPPTASASTSSPPTSVANTPAAFTSISPNTRDPEARDPIKASESEPLQSNITHIYIFVFAILAVFLTLAITITVVCVICIRKRRKMRNQATTATRGDKEKKTRLSYTVRSAKPKDKPKSTKTKVRTKDKMGPKEP